MLSLPASSEQVVQVWDEQGDGALGEEWAEGQGPVSCKEWGYIWLVTSGVPWGSKWFLASPFKTDFKVHESIPRRAPNLEKEPASTSSEEWLKPLDFSGLERGRLRDAPTIPWENGGRHWALLSGMQCQDMWEWIKAASITWILNLMWGDISLLRGWGNIARSPVEVDNASCLLVFKRHLENVPNVML